MSSTARPCRLREVVLSAPALESGVLRQCFRARHLMGLFPGRTPYSLGLGLSRCCLDIAVLEYAALRPGCFLDDDIHHGPRKVVGPNHQVGKQYPKYWVERAQQAVAEIRLLA